jgi:hypothetical protein
MHTRSPINSDSPNLLEMVSVKPLSLSFGDCLSLSEAKVDSRICNLMTVNGGCVLPSQICNSVFGWNPCQNMSTINSTHVVLHHCI